MSAVGCNLMIEAISHHAVALTLPAELNFAAAIQTPFEIADRFKTIVLGRHINCFSFHIIGLTSSKHTLKLGRSTLWIIYGISPVEAVSLQSNCVVARNAQ